jgi:hypothetical protein
VFLQSDILRAAEGLRDAVEEAAADAFELAPPHGDPARVFFADSPPAEVEGSSGDAAGDAAEAGGGAAAGGAASSGDAWQFLETSGDQWSSSDDGDGGGPFASQWARAGWLRDNPVGVPTEREYYVAATQGGDVYRVLLVRR